MNNSLKKIWNVISSILVALVVLLALLLVGARVVGLQVFTVLSGSMEPTYHTGSLIYVKKVDPYTITDGQPITFMLDENTVATHRVVGIVPDEEDPTVIRFRTKGDANEAEDGSLVHYKNVIGTPVFTIPYLGYVADYIQHPPGMYIAISGGAVLLLLVFLPDVFASDKDEEKKKKRKKSAGKHDPDEPVPAERTERLRKVAETLLSEEELQELDARLAEGPLTRGEYQTIRKHMEQLSEEVSAQQ
ncbi:MAG: signal peptidase I [Eubacteriales bacterium]|nr:signal peptidase I [Eubacteriales bacterium]